VQRVPEDGIQVLVTGIQVLVTEIQVLVTGIQVLVTGIQVLVTGIQVPWRSTPHCCHTATIRVWFLILDYALIVPELPLFIKWATRSRTLPGLCVILSLIVSQRLYSRSKCSWLPWSVAYPRNLRRTEKKRDDGSLGIVIKKASLGGPEPGNTSLRPEHLKIPFLGVFSPFFQFCANSY
jgi:hypothetical protein